MSDVATSSRPRLQFEFIGTSKKPRWRVHVKLEDDLLYTDTLDLNIAKNRKKFATSAREAVEDQGGDVFESDVEAALLQQLNRHDAPREKLSQSDLLEMLETLGIDVLGEKADRSILYQATATGRQFYVKEASKWASQDIIQAVGEIAIGAIYNGNGSDVPGGMMRLSDIRDALALAAHLAGRIDDFEFCGRGIWAAGDKLLIVNGAAAQLYDGEGLELVETAQIGSIMIQANSSQPWLPGLSDILAEMNANRAREAFDSAAQLFGNWRWKHDMDARVIAGLVAATYCQSLWQWRPMVGIHGPTASGKTTVLSSCLRPLLGPFAKRIERPTDAGLRQFVGNDSLPVLVDEFDDYRHRDAVLEQMRTAGGGGTVIRGTRSQEAREFRMRHLFWVASIESGTKRAQDRNRFLQLELERPAAGSVLRLPAEDVISKLGVELAAASIWAIQVAAALAVRLKSTSIDIVDSRLIECFAVPAAMMATLLHGRDVSDELAIEILREMIGDRDITIVQSEGEEERLLKAILATRRTFRNQSQVETLTIAQLLHGLTAEFTNLIPTTYTNAYDFEKQLQGHGVRLIKKKDNRLALFLYPAAIQRELLEGTDWADLRIDELLRRLPGAKYVQQRIAGLRPHGIEIDWTSRLASLGEEDSFQDQEDENVQGDIEDL